MLEAYRGYRNGFDHSIVCRSSSWTPRYKVHDWVVKVLDPRSRGLGFDSHSTGHVWKELVKLSIHTASGHPAALVMGTRWNEKLVMCEWLQLQNICCILPRGMRLWKTEFQYLGVIDSKSDQPSEISVKWTHLPLHLYARSVGSASLSVYCATYDVIFHYGRQVSCESGNIVWYFRYKPLLNDRLEV